MNVSTARSFHVSTNAVQSVTTQAAILAGYYLDNTANSATSYYQFFNAASTAVVLGTTVPSFVIPVPAAGAANLPTQVSVASLSFAVTTTYNGSTAPSSAVDATLFYL